MPACFADHLLLLAYSGFLLPFGILFSGHTAELWDAVQLNHSPFHCHPAVQNTRFALSWLPVLSQFLPTRRLHNSPPAEPAAPGTTSGPAASVSISILSAWATPCCISIIAKSKAFPPCQEPCCDCTAADQGVISADSALAALLRMKVKRRWMRCLLWGSSEYLQEAVALGHICLY